MLIQTPLHSNGLNGLLGNICASGLSFPLNPLLLYTISIGHLIVHGCRQLAWLLKRWPVCCSPLSKKETICFKHEHVYTTELGSLSQTNRREYIVAFDEGWGIVFVKFGNLQAQSTCAILSCLPVLHQIVVGLVGLVAPCAGKIHNLI